MKKITLFSYTNYIKIICLSLAIITLSLPSAYAVKVVHSDKVTGIPIPGTSAAPPSTDYNALISNKPYNDPSYPQTYNKDRPTHNCLDFACTMHDKCKKAGISSWVFTVVPVKYNSFIEAVKCLNPNPYPVTGSGHATLIVEVIHPGVVKKYCLMEPQSAHKYGCWYENDGNCAPGTPPSWIIKKVQEKIMPKCDLLYPGIYPNKHSGIPKRKSGT